MVTKLDNCIGQLGYILDCLVNYRNIINSGNCNACKNIKDCEYIPKVGELVRYNCPFYEKRSGGN